MKFNDKGFIFKFKDYTQVQIFSAGVAVLDMKIYEDKVCKSTFKCQDLDTFNKENLSSTYPNNFLKSLFDKKNKEKMKNKRVIINQNHYDLNEALSCINNNKKSHFVNENSIDFQKLIAIPF